MSWREQYRQASFRGIHFKVKVAESSFGRRQVTHEYPLRDLPYTEDMGRAGDEFSVEGYVIGEDYHLARDELIRACRDEAGPGTLIHPYLGEKIVVCKGLKVRESSDEGRMATITMTFLEAGEALAPDVIEDPVAAVTIKADAMKAAAKQSFVDKFLTDGMPGFVLDAAQGLVEDLAGALDLRGVVSDLEAAADFAYEVRNLTADAADLAASPSLLADRVTSTFGLLRRAFSNAGDMLLGLFDDNEGASSVAASTPSRRQQRDNEDAFRGLIRQIALADAATKRVAETQPSLQDAVTARDALADRMDAEAEAAEDGSYSALLDLRAQVVRSLPAPGEALPNLITYTPPATLPALVIAHQLYGDASRADEIVARNRPVHPGFMPGGKPLEILSDG